MGEVSAGSEEDERVGVNGSGRGAVTALPPTFQRGEVGEPVNSVARTARRQLCTDRMHQHFFVAGLRFIHGVDACWPLLEIDLLALADQIVRRMDVDHFLPVQSIIRQPSGLAPP